MAGTGDFFGEPSTGIWSLGSGFVCVVRPQFCEGWVAELPHIGLEGRLVGVVLVNRWRKFRFGRCQFGEGAREGEWEFGDEVWGHVGGGEAWSGLSHAADFGTF